MKISRQRKWQLNKIKQGLCSICGAESIYGGERCRSCYIMWADMNMLGMRMRRGCKPWKPGARGRPPMTTCKKKAYESEEDAFCSICTRMKYQNKDLDWLCFKVYKCQKCGKWHLTKAFNGKVHG